MRSAQLAGLNAAGVSDAHASPRFRRVTAPKLVDIIIGDFIAQQAGRYELKHKNMEEDLREAFGRKAQNAIGPYLHYK